MNGDASNSTACGCPTPPFPGPTANAAGLDAIAYRIGDFLAFRRRLLKPLEREVELRDWVPKPDGDLALQMVDWWAYIADVLTFYNERIANEDYLRTAQLPESVAYLVQTLGYRPRPALGSRGQLAGLLSPGARPPATVPQGMQIQSKPGPGKTPQVFEVDQQVLVNSPDLVVADVVPATAPLLGAGGTTLWLAGKVSGVKIAERLLLIDATALSTQTFSRYAWVKVTTVTPKQDPLGANVTEIAFAYVTSPLSGSLNAGDFTLLRPRQSSPLWTYPTSKANPVVQAGSLELAGIARGVQAGALIFIDAPDSATTSSASSASAAPSASVNLSALDLTPELMRERASSFSQFAGASSIIAAVGGSLATAASPTLPAPAPGIVSSYSESVWYANGDGPSPTYPAPSLNLGTILSELTSIASASTAPASSPATPIGMLHATVAFTPGLTLPATPAASAYTVRWDWLAVGRIVPVLAPSDYRYSGTNSIVVDAASKASFPTSSAAALLEDQAGVAAQATVAPQGGDPATATLSGFSTTSPPKFSTPIDVLFNLIAVSRGKTVASEVLGSGDTRAAGQDFTLVKSPVTYFYDPASKSGDGFSSTAKVSVNGIQWREARSFFGAAPTDQIFVLREDDQGQTHVQFGDGANGARLPTGVGNVVATYRYGAEGDPPDPETLTTVLTPVPGLKGVRNPLPPTGGADPDSAARIRTLAPASVLTLNRVVSIDDFAVTAATAGGVTKTAASFDVDPVSGRPMTTVYVAGDDGAVASATAALAGAGAPMANVLVVPATPVEMVVTVSFLRDPRYADTDVSARLRTALADPDAGLLGANVLSVGQAIYDSQIAMACLAVAGVEAVTAISFAPPGLRLVPEVVFGRIGFVWRRPIGGLLLSSSARHDPGVGKYFFVPNDTGHVQISGSAGP